jgi:hypothetical protein
MPKNIADRKIPNGHYAMVKMTQLKQTFPHVQIGPEVKDEIEAKVYAMIQKAVERANKNGRVRLFPHDL